NVDGRVVRECTSAGMNDRQARCQWTGRLDPGRHFYGATVVDHRGRAGSDNSHLIIVRAEGVAPLVSPPPPPRGLARRAHFTITPTATDATGINEMRVDADAPPYYRLCSGGGMRTATCTLDVTPPAGRRVVTYSASATDAELLTTAAPRRIAV